MKNKASPTKARGLGSSAMSYPCDIENLDKARAYLRRPLPGMRLIEISKALVALNESDPCRGMGYPDVLKLRSYITLFANVDSADPIFQEVID